jgi:hypothetical protein
MLVRRKATHSPRPSMRCAETVQTTENWHGSIGLMTLVARHSPIAFRPAAVIWRRMASTGLAPALMVSRSTVANSARKRPATMSPSNPWARTSSASVAPCGLLASSFSSSSVRRGCGLRRRFRMVVIVQYLTQAIYFQLTGVPLGCLGMRGPGSRLRPRPSWGEARADQWGRGRARPCLTTTRSKPTPVAAAAFLSQKGTYQDFWSSYSPALRSAFKGQPTRITDLDTGHLYRRAVGRRNYLALCCCKALVDESGDHVSIEFIGVHEEVLYNAVWSAGEQRQRTVLFPTDARFSWERPHASEGTRLVEPRLSPARQRAKK